MVPGLLNKYPEVVAEVGLNCDVAEEVVPVKMLVDEEDNKFTQELIDENVDDLATGELNIPLFDVDEIDKIDEIDEIDSREVVADPFDTLLSVEEDTKLLAMPTELEEDDVEVTTDE